MDSYINNLKQCNKCEQYNLISDKVSGIESELEKIYNRNNTYMQNIFEEHQKMMLIYEDIIKKINIT